MDRSRAELYASIVIINKRNFSRVFLDSSPIVGRDTSDMTDTTKEMTKFCLELINIINFIEYT